VESAKKGRDMAFSLVMDPTSWTINPNIKCS